MLIRAGRAIEMEARRRKYTVEEMLAIRAVENQEDAEDEFGYTFVHTFKRLLNQGLDNLLRTRQLCVAEPKAKYSATAIPDTTDVAKLLSNHFANRRIPR
ncbi:MAG: hypothetical protein WC976_06635 [Caldisericia bacterium]